MKPNSRDVADAKVVLGRDAVKAALNNPDLAALLFTKHAGAVAEASQGIIDRRKDVAAAQAYAASLPPEVRFALAGAWAGNAGQRAVDATGLEER